jgi:hypothetical protein
MRGFKTSSALAALLFAASQAHAQPVVITPQKQRTSEGFSDPHAKPQRGFSGAMTTIIIGGSSGAYGVGGSATTGSIAPADRIQGPMDWDHSDSLRPFPQHAFPDSVSGFGPADPFLNPRDPYAKDLRRNTR